MGIEINEYAAELARVTIWIGELQWMIKHGMAYNTKPILQTMNQIENRDALLNEDGTEAVWPQADVIVGNPPFLGDKKMLGELGEVYVITLRSAYKGRVPGGADLVTYWFEKARAAGARTGLVATNSIRGGSNREVLKRITESGRIFNAWSDEPWINDGAAVRVSIVCFSDKNSSETTLDGQNVLNIYPDLTPQKSTTSTNLTTAKILTENKNLSFIGTQKSGDFDIDGNFARRLLLLPNPNGEPSYDVVKPFSNGISITKRPTDTWIIDFGCDISELTASLYEKPFEFISQHVRDKLIAKKIEWENNGKNTQFLDKQIETWWLQWCPRPEMRDALKTCWRYIATPRVAKHRLFVWMNAKTLPDCQLVVISRDDDTTLGVLHSKFHEMWALRMGTSLEDRPRYTPTTTFETFPFPAGLTPNIPAIDYANNPHAQAIAAAAKRLVDLRDNWLNPREWTEWIITHKEEEAGFPKRPVAKLGHEAELKKRTLTNLYNQRPTWLSNIHKELDAAVAAAYGWSADLSDDEILKRLLQLNMDRSIL